MSQLALYGVALVLIVYAFYKWAIANETFFSKYNLPHLRPKFLTGNTGAFIFGGCGMNELLDHIYNSFPNEKWVGLFEFRQPLFFIRDSDLIKQMAVKDFDYFEDHRPFIDGTVDDMFGNSLLMLRGEKWRDMRATLSPAFTGSKMRQMFELVRDCAINMSDELRDRAMKGGRIQVEVKELFSRYATDVIATSAFGIRVNSFKDVENEFYVTGKETMNFANLKSTLKVLMIQFCPWVGRLLNIQFIDKAAGRFFRSMVLDNIATRLKQGIFRPDLINLLMQLKTKSKITEHAAETTFYEKDSAGFATVDESAIGKQVVRREWSDNEIAAQCFLFFLAGFDTSSTCLSFFAYELALNPDVQERLYRECVETQQQLGPNGKLTYDVLPKMKYMDQVMSEVLRRWPPLMVVDRVCVKDYEFNDGKRQVTIKKGNGVWLPLYSVMHDPNHYPEPKMFDPDRFSEENKRNIEPGTYVPFGIGPRNCIGSRFALMEVKAVIYYLLLNFTIAPNEKTKIPIKLVATPGSLVAESGYDLDLKPRLKAY